MHPNTTKQNKTKHEFRVQWGGSGAFIATNLDTTSWHKLLLLHHFSSFCTEFHSVTKWSQMHPNTMKRNKRWVWGPMGWIGCICCENIWRNFVAQTSALIAPVQPILHRVSCSNEIVPNAPKHYEMHQNMSLLSNGVDQVHSLRKIQTRLRGTNFCIICTNSVHFAPSLIP